jgi:hypothetical protein
LLLLLSSGNFKPPPDVIHSVFGCNQNAQRII